MRHGEEIGWDFVSRNYFMSQTFGVSSMTGGCMSRAGVLSLSAMCCAYLKLISITFYNITISLLYKCKTQRVYTPWYILFMKLLVQVEMDIGGLHSTSTDTLFYGTSTIHNFHPTELHAPSFQAKRLQPAKGGEDTRIGQDEKSHTRPLHSLVTITTNPLRNGYVPTRQADSWYESGMRQWGNEVQYIDPFVRHHPWFSNGFNEFLAIHSPTLSPTIPPPPHRP